jgi:hypothetical protein
MPEPMWLDTNVISRIANGDVMLEVELLKVRNNGFQFWLPPGVEMELFDKSFKGKPVPLEQIFRKRMAMARLGTQVDRTIDEAKKVDLEWTKFDLSKKLWLGDGDFMAAVASSEQPGVNGEPKIFTCDERVVKNADRFGLDAWTRSTPAFDEPRPTHITEPSEEPGLEIYNVTTSGAFVGSLVAGLNGLQVQSVTKARMMDAGDEAFEAWNLYKKSFKQELRQHPGRGCAISFWFWYVVATSITLADDWTFVDLSHDFYTKPGPVPSSGLMAPNVNPNGRFVHMDVWLPPVPQAAPKPSAPARGLDAGPGRNYSPQMDSVEADVYSALDANPPKSVQRISWETGFPEGDVTIVLQRLQGKNMATFTCRGESLGWVRLQ